MPRTLHAWFPLALLATTLAPAAARAGSPGPAEAAPAAEARNARPGGAATCGIAAAPAVGEPAPDLCFRSPRFGWQRLDALCGDAGVLLVFDPAEAELAALQRDLAALVARGVEPVAVMRQAAGANWAAIERLGLRFSLLSDPEGVVGEAFGIGPAGAVVAASHASGEAVSGGVAGMSPGADAAPAAWFLVDRRTRLIAAGLGAGPEHGFAAVVAAAAELPAGTRSIAADPPR
jgi:peroxiredoxin